MADSFIPEGDNIYSYDVISQYPSVMHKYPMPVKSMRHVIGGCEAWSSSSN